MNRSDLMARLRQLARASIQTGQAAQGDEAPGSESRRRFTQGALAAAAAAATWSVSPAALATVGRTVGKIGRLRDASVGIVGAGIAGLACATELGRMGWYAQVFEAADRVGGRCASLRGLFPGQVVERGGEFFSRSHHTMLGYARELGLSVENANIMPGETYFHFGGSRYTEAQVANEYREFASSMQQDLLWAGSPTADRFGPHAEALDLMTVDEYLDLRGAGSLLRRLVASACQAEYGVGLDDLGAMAFLRVLHGNPRSKFSPYGGDAGERMRVVGGNDQIASGLADRLIRPVALQHRLVSVRRTAAGKVRLVFEAGGGIVERDFQAVVLALPFSVLRDVEMHTSLNLPSWKNLAINASAMGNHGRIALGFKSPFWHTNHGLNGTGYTDLPRVQATWEARSGNADTAVLAAHVGGEAGLALGQQGVQADAAAFLAQLEKVMPGASAMASRDENGQLVAHVESWSHNPLAKGSYPCNRPGYFTTLAHNEGKAVGNLLFAGDHTSSIYEWQGFMEGAALSGLRAAAEVHALAQA